MTAAPRFRILRDSIVFRVRLTPKGGRDQVEGWATASDGSSHLKARVRAAPESGKANAAITELIARMLGVPRSCVDIISGQKARLKTVAVAGDTSELTRKLEGFGVAT